MDCYWPILPLILLLAVIEHHIVSGAVRYPAESPGKRRVVSSTLCEKEPAIAVVTALIRAIGVAKARFGESLEAWGANTARSVRNDSTSRINLSAVFRVIATVSPTDEDQALTIQTGAVMCREVHHMDKAILFNSLRGTGDCRKATDRPSNT